ncbi:MAG: hypothetical protein MUF79_09965 [Burkholderiales bacterium]|jgi:hypothetical protein|nr:hypothetical protein [Burkholderiales bacterium]
MKSLRAATCIAVSAALAGCAGVQTATALNTGGPVAGPCTSCVIVDGGLYASIGLSAAVSNAIVYGMFGAMFLYDGLNWRPPPEMDENRTVHEQDCTKPLENPRANLKCKAPEPAAARP